MKQTTGQAYIVGSGIASLASAVFLIRDGHFQGENIHILEQSKRDGGALEAYGTANLGYVTPGGRMFADHYVCTFDLFSTIPSIEDINTNMKDELFEFNEEVVSDAKCRLLKDGKKVDVSSYGLSLKDQLDMLHVAFSAGGKSDQKIEDWFSASFFKTNFWLLWATTFSFQTWDNVDELRRYFLRFMELLPGFNHLKGILRTRYNQYDSLILPIVKWLKARGVHFEMNTRVTNIDFELNDNNKTAKAIACVHDGVEKEITLTEDDYVFVTLGSMTANLTQGSMATVPPIPSQELDGSWALWRKIAKNHPDFGNPDTFINNVAQTQWISFTVTLTDSLFFDLMEKFTGNVAGTGGLVTFADSNWFMSIVLFHEPFWLDQPKNVCVFWGDGLFPDREGNYIQKKMSECTGKEILSEVLYHLKIEEKQSIIEKANCIPVMMPFITSQFQTRKPGDRPQVVPEGATNFAFLGQYCEMPEDVVFTVEYSVRSAMTAVYSLLNVEKEVPPVYQAQKNLIVDFKASLALLR